MSADNRICHNAETFQMSSMLVLGDWFHNFKTMYSTRKTIFGKHWSGNKYVVLWSNGIFKWFATENLNCSVGKWYAEKTF